MYPYINITSPSSKVMTLMWIWSMYPDFVSTQMEINNEKEENTASNLLIYTVKTKNDVVHMSPKKRFGVVIENINVANLRKHVSSNPFNFF
jgi:hypothetical protein